MSQQVTLADVVEALKYANTKIENLENDVRRLNASSGKWDNVHGSHPISTNLSNIREMFLLEIIREKGLLEGLDLSAIEEKVRDKLVVAEHIPWATGEASQKASVGNLKKALAEIRDDVEAVG